MDNSEKSVGASALTLALPQTGSATDLGGRGGAADSLRPNICCFRKPMIIEPPVLSSIRMTPRQETDEHDESDKGVKPLPPPSLAVPTLTLPTDSTSVSPPKLRRPLSMNAAEFYPSSLTPTSPDMTPATPTTSTTASPFLIRPSLELNTPKRSPTVDSLLSALTPDEPRTPAKEEDTDELWAKLRCGSLRTEEVAEREKQKQERLAKRQNRCADYPGLAFGSAMFGSDTNMRFNIIKNELHNIMRSQLKRVDGEVNALSSRVKKLDMNLEESERLIRTATSALSECVSLQIEESKSRSQETESQSNLSAFDQHILYLETQLKDAKIKASHSLQIMEDCDKAQETLLLEPAPLQLNLPTLHLLPPLITPTANTPQSSMPTIFDPATILNNNLEEAIHNVNNNNSSSSSTTNNMFENEANNNNTSSVSTAVMLDGVRENKNCLQSLMTEEDSANGNTVHLNV